MKTRILAVAAAFAAISGGSAFNQQQQPQFPDMTFFVSSAGPDGANLGGLEGADKLCQTLATAAGRRRESWKAYLSTQGRWRGQRARPHRQGAMAERQRIVIATSIDVTRTWRSENSASTRA